MEELPEVDLIVVLRSYQDVSTRQNVTMASIAPSVPGLSTHGKSPEEAMEKMKMLIKVWFQQPARINYEEPKMLISIKTISLNELFKEAQVQEILGS